MLGEDIANLITEEGFAKSTIIADSARPEMIEEIRSVLTKHCQIIVGGCAFQRNRQTAIKIGADDYVTKPFSVPELLARIRNILKRVNVLPAPTTLEFEDVVMDINMQKKI